MNAIVVKNLVKNYGPKNILKTINLTIKKGEFFSLMGPNGSGKSTLAHVLSGREGYDVSDGNIFYNDKDLLEMVPEIRAGEGLSRLRGQDDR